MEQRTCLPVGRDGVDEMTELFKQKSFPCRINDKMTFVELLILFNEGFEHHS